MVSQMKGLKRKDLEAYAQDLLKEVNLEADIHQKVSELSGGMRRRVTIALSTIGDPDMIIFDEPTTGLDPETRHHV